MDMTIDEGNLICLRHRPGHRSNIIVMVFI